jgi:hydroxymethylbilane synthase
MRRRCKNYSGWNTAMRKLVLATRGSKLALAQATTVATLLRTAHAELDVELRIIQTKGDLVLDRALSRIGDKGLFVTEIEQALLAGEADLAVHSCKDLPSVTTAGLVLAAFPCRSTRCFDLTTRTAATRLADRRTDRHVQPAPRLPDSASAS